MWRLATMVSIALVAGACGSSVKIEGGGGGEPDGTGASGAAGGTPAAFPPPDPPELGPCPVEAATNPADQDVFVLLPDNDPGCPSTPGGGSCAVEDTLCIYEVACQSGVVPITLDCEHGYPTTGGYEPHPCSQPYDYCPILDELCRPTTDGQALSPATGSDDPYACPWDRPAEGSGCTGNYYIGPRCGYWCGDAHEAWTVAECVAPGSVQPGYWIYDDACRSDCTE